MFIVGIIIVCVYLDITDVLVNGLLIGLSFTISPHLLRNGASDYTRTNGSPNSLST